MNQREKADEKRNWEIVAAKLSTPRTGNMCQNRLKTLTTQFKVSLFS